MKFKKYITEMISTSKWNNLREAIDKDCAPFIKELKGCNTLLYRGVKTPPRFYDKKTPRTDRKPRVIDITLHTKLGKETKKMFGWNLRIEGIFTTNNVSNADLWGSPSIIFPIGKFKYAWNKNVHDLYDAYDQWPTYMSKDGSMDHMLKELWDYNIMDSLKNYKTTGLNNYLSRTFRLSECVIKCKEYYSINYEWNNTLMEWYGKRVW